MLGVNPAFHIHVHPGVDGFSAGFRLRSGDAMVDELTDGIPIANNKAAKFPFAAENVGQGKGICRTGRAVEIVESAHDRAGAGINSRFERRQINLPQGVDGNIHRIVIPAAFGSAVSDIMLRTSDDLGRIGKIVSLKAFHLRARHGRTQIGIFSSAFGNATPARVTGDVHHRSEGPMGAGSACFFRRHGCGPFHQIRMPTGGLGQRDWENGSVAVNDVVAEDQGNAQSGLFYCDLLNSIGLIRTANIQQGAEFSRLGQCIGLFRHIIVLGHLTDLFFQSHFSQECIDFCLDFEMIVRPLSDRQCLIQKKKNGNGQILKNTHGGFPLIQVQIHPSCSTLPKCTPTVLALICSQINASQTQ